MTRETLCRVDGCGQPIRCSGRCARHYGQWRRAVPSDLRPRPTLRDRLAALSTADPASGCWIWQGSLNVKGYGSVRGNGRTQIAHRAAYESWVGPIPLGATIDHLCRDRRCINPEHLEAVPHRENLLRGTGFAAVNAAKTHCPSGHPYAGENLIVKPGGRCCRACRDARNQARRHTNRAA